MTAFEVSCHAQGTAAMNKTGPMRMNTVTRRVTLLPVVGHALPIVVLMMLSAPILSQSAESPPDWPQWRGPNRNGVVTNSPALLDRIPAGGLKLLWEYALDVENMSSPVAAGGRVYTHVRHRLPAAAPTDVPDGESATKPKFTDKLVCLNLADGRELWQVKPTGKPALCPYGAPNTPCVVDGKVYFLEATGVACCLGAVTGKVIWTREITGIKGIPASSILIVDNRVIVSVNSVWALSPTDGAVLWKTPDTKNDCAVNSLTLWRHKGKTYVIGAKVDRKFQFQCLDVVDGRTLWTFDLGKGSEAGIACSPVVSGDFLVTFDIGVERRSGLRVHRMELGGATEIIFEAIAGGSNSTSQTPVVNGNLIYVQVGDQDPKEDYVMCYDIARKSVVWRACGGASCCSPILADGKLIISAIDLRDAATGKVLLKYPGGGPGDHSSCALADGRLLFHGRKKLRCYDLRAPVGAKAGANP
jgi:outer membrane protein assembly factor BamB